MFGLDEWIAGLGGNGLMAATSAACRELADSRHCNTVVLSGGVFQNRRLLEGTERTLLQEGMRVLIPQRLPPNDGGIAYGQAAVAAASALPQVAI